MIVSASISNSDRRASDELGLWEPKRALTLEAARTHTKRVEILRRVLLAISAILIAILAWQFISDRRGTNFVNDPSESVKMVEPRYSGRTSDGLPFYLIADTAIRRMKDRNTVVLENPVLKFNRVEGVESSSIIAENGSYNDIEKILNLRSNVNLETDDGNKCDTTHARIFNVEKRIEGDEAIDCSGEFGTVNGNGFAIEDAYKTFIFKNGVTAQLTQKRDVNDGDRPFGFQGSGPINIKSRTGVYQGDTIDLRGNVKVVQGGGTITSNKMKIFRVQESGETDSSSLKLGAIRRIIATDDFRYKSAQNDIRGAKGVYDRQRNIMTVTGNVIVIQSSGNRYEAETLTYNTKSETIRFSGQCLGRDCESSGRTRIVIPGQEN